MCVYPQICIYQTISLHNKMLTVKNKKRVLDGSASLLENGNINS